jgi:hypothetical protein
MDYYKRASSIAAQLGECGMGEWRDRLDLAAGAGATATDTLMALRWELRQLQNLGADRVPEKIYFEVKRLIQDIDAAWH